MGKLPIFVRDSNTRIFSLALLLVLLLSFGHSLSNAFVYDDELVITKNLFIRSFSHLGDLFNPNYFQASGELSYRPLVTLSYFLDYAMFGLDRWGYHAHSLILHFGVGLALMWLLGRLGLKGWPVWLATTLFALHPVVVESVVSPANREELHCALFMILALGTVLPQVPGQMPARSFHTLGLPFFALALLSKETALVLPLLLVGYWYCYRRSAAVGFPTVCLGSFVAVACVYAVVRFVLLQNPLEEAMAYPGGSIGTSLVAHAPGWSRMLQLFAIPSNLNVDYTRWDPSGMLQGVLIAFGLVMGLVLIVWFGSKKAPALSFGALWILCTFMPVAGFVPIANIFAERFLYIPLIGCAMMLAGTGPALRGKLGVTTILATMAWIGLLGGMTHQRVGVWKTSESLWADSLLKNPNSARAHNNLGNALFDLGSLEAAGLHYRRAAQSDPRMQEAWRNLANYHDEKGEYDAAVANAETALNINQKQPEVFVLYGDMLLKADRWADAEVQYRKALRMRPQFAEAWNNLGGLLIRTGRAEEGKAAFETALRIASNYPDALNNLGTALAQEGDLEGGLRLWKKTLKLNSHHAGARENLLRYSSVAK